MLRNIFHDKDGTECFVKLLAKHYLPSPIFFSFSTFKSLVSRLVL